MIKPPYTKWINDIKTKLGFNRTMTASGTDVVDAINKQALQVANLGPYNGLDSDSTTAALSAAQGKALDSKTTVNNYSFTSGPLFSSVLNCIKINGFVIISGYAQNLQALNADTDHLIGYIPDNFVGTWATTGIIDGYLCRIYTYQNKVNLITRNAIATNKYAYFTLIGRV